MDFKFNFDTLLLPLASSLVGLLPVVLTLVVNWLEKRTQTERINNVLNQVNNRVGFLTTWYTLQKEVVDPAQLSNVKIAVDNELRDVYELFMDVVLDPDKETKQRQEAIANYRKTGKFRRFFLLYTPYNTRGLVFQSLYFMCVMPLIAVAGYMVYTFIKYSNPLYGIPQENLIIAGVVVVLMIVFHWMGRAAAREVEDRMAKLDQKTIPIRPTKGA